MTIRASRWMRRGLSLLVSSGFGLLTLDVLWGVVSRYLLGRQSGFTEEVAIYLLIWISLLGAPIAYAEHGHLGVDYLVDKFDPTAQKLTRATVEIIVGAFAIVVLIVGGATLVRQTWEAGQTSPAIGIPVAHVYLATPLSGLCLLLQTLAHLREILRPTQEQPP